MRLLGALLAVLVVAAPTVAAGPTAPARPRADAAPPPAEWDEAFPPHRTADNLYYVGSKGLATYLVTTSRGHILINSGFDRTVPLIRRGVEQLGFKLADVKILLSSHAHNDHVEGLALLRTLTGADVYVMRGDDQVIASGGAGQYVYDARWKPCPVKRILDDGAKVTLGEATLVARRTPGHTRGCTTWTMRTKDAGRDLDAVIVGSPNVKPPYRLVGNKEYPEIAADYEKAFQIWKALPCDLFLGAHGNYYGLEEKYPRLKPGAANPFVDPAGYRAYIEDREKAFRATLADQRKGAAAR
jgi:metallo-beta-lactamase class B